MNKIQIKRGAGAPSPGVLDVGELGWDKTNKKLYVGNGTNNPSTQINGFEYYEKTTDEEIDELLYTFINSSDLPNNDSKHIVLYVSESGCKIPTNKYFVEICKSSSNYGIINAIGYGTSTGPRHYMRIWAENALQDWINMRDLQSFGVTASAAEINKLDGVTATTTEINVLDGVTASTAEINKLKGLTPTTTELNYVDGVTSNIQTQLDGKSASGHKHSASEITSGALPLEYGGTGSRVDLNNAPNNAIIRKFITDDYNQLYYTATNKGAFYATSENGAAKFGTLPIAQGGTGATNAATALANLGGVQIDHLWTIADTNASVGQIDIPLPSGSFNKYDYLWFFFDGGTKQVFVRPSTYGLIQYAANVYYDSSKIMDITQRTINLTITTDVARISEAHYKYFDSGWSVWPGATNWLVPYKIYGVKINSTTTPLNSYTPV